ncbi:UDP-3-O-(3-hydroxymyristoyl)glucosamine N-acyltransferase [Rubrimonas cliftonensis]|uniref:UDP-3-O-acylglucosamine N-acyltransferase n=1 Tax=Rubrimonas cliftonensis TaxID=89524 RepID=A0A1H3ZBB1_9RHOB|nr:UDP-3-O-(3-hydroxymyristoyl)glucosamine N-acyltransferase [Rubrimonas cliftonensis]SEA20622.1 UDP-3-O-[3-hydroxymyristoyl] glucosamine N-acyltransferase [Rubrimonas cliftonensis]
MTSAPYVAAGDGVACTVAQLAAECGLRFEGDGAIALRGMATPCDAVADMLAVAGDAAHAAQLGEGAARVALLAEGADWRALGLEAALFAARPRHAMAALTRRFDPPPRVAIGAHPSSVIDPTAEIDPTAAIGPLCVVSEGARIGAGAVLVAQVFVGAGAAVGPGCLIHPGARLCHGVRVGARCVIHANAVVGGDGFSFVTERRGAAEAAKAEGRVDLDARNMSLSRIHSLGAVTLGDDVEIGAGTTIDRGTLADTTVADGAKIDNLVQVGHNVSIGENAMLCAQTGVAGSSRIGARVVLGGQSGVADHVTVGEDVVAAARAGIGADARPRTVLMGAPALERSEALGVVLATRRLPRLIEAVRLLKKRLSELERSR